MMKTAVFFSQQTVFLLYKEWEKISGNFISVTSITLLLFCLRLLYFQLPAVSFREMELSCNLLQEGSHLLSIADVVEYEAMKSL